MSPQEALLKIKAMFAEATIEPSVDAPEVAVANFAEYVLASGVKVMVDKLEVGGKVTLLDEAGNEVPAPVGEHTLADGSVIFDIETNQMTILTDCNSEISLNDANIIINMIIHYDISCVACYCPVPEFTPINCEITEEYCETEETKVIYDIKWPLFGIDLLDNLDIIPTRCQELPNYPDCGVIESKQIEFRNARNAYLSYINNYLLALSVGRISYAQSIPVVLPPSRYEGDYFYNGPENVGWTQFKVIQGCSCKKIFEENGLVGPQYDFDIVWLTEVQSYGDLPLTGNFGEFCFVIDDGVFYKWDPNTNTWINESSPIIGYPDIEDCAAVQRAQRDYYLLSLNQLMLVWRSFTWSSFHIPLYQIFKYNS